MKGKTRTRMKEMVKKFKLLKQVRETKKKNTEENNKISLSMAKQIREN